MRALAILLGLLSTLALATPTFPILSGRVVDEAGLISPQTEAQLTRELAEHERSTREQLVVVTVRSLQGYPIEDYGYQLGRHWGIGQAKLNNGAILLVAPNERAVRIEVGYGLEGRLTDILAHDIIQTQILPQFRQGQFEPGIVAGVRAIFAALQGSYEPSPPSRDRPEVSQTAFALGALGLFLLGLVPFLGALAIGAAAALLVWILTQALSLAIIAGIAVFLLLLLAPRAPRRRGFHYPGGFGGGLGGGGFSGGGGSFGGGGASGRW